MAVNLTASGATYNASGKFGSSLSAGFAYSPGNSSAIITTPSAFTVRGWVKRTTSTSNAVFLGSANGFYLSMQGGKASANVSNSPGTVVITGTTDIFGGSWHFIEFSVGAAGMLLFVNGNLEAQNAGPFGGPLNQPFVLNALTGSGGFPWGGEIDDFAVFSGQMNTANYTPPTAATSSQAANLLALYKLDGNTLDSAGASTATVLYQNNFDSNTAGELPTGWANKVGTWAVGTLNPVSAPNTFGSTSGADGDVALYTAVASVDMKVSTSQKLTQGAGGLIPMMGHIVRSDLANANNYTVVFVSATSTKFNVAFFKKIGNAYSQFASIPVTLARAVGDVVNVVTEITGTNLKVYVGVNAPVSTTPVATATDTSLSGTGFAGLYYALETSNISIAIDNFSLEGEATGSTVTGVTVSPASATVSGAAQQQFSASVTGTGAPSQAVTWSAPSGSISSSGLFTAPAATASAQSIVVTATSTQDNTKSGTAAVTVPAAGAAVNNALLNGTANVLFSPYNWNVQASSAKTINAGAYFKTLFSGTTCTLNFDMTGVASPLPQISYRVDGFGPWITVSLAATVAITIPSDTSGYADKPGHLLEVYVKSMTETQARWSTQATAVSLTGIILDASKVLRAPTALPLRAIFYGDSITEGVRTLNNTAGSDTSRNDSGQSWSLEVGRRLGAEIGNVGFGAQGFLATGSGSVPPLPTSYNLLYAGAARSFSPEPDFIVLMHGTNDSGNVTSAATSVLNGLLAATASTRIIVLRPFNGAHAASLQAAISASTAPSRCTYVNTAGFFTAANSSDGLHPYGVENIVNIAPKVSEAVRAVLSNAAIPPTLNSRTVTFQLATGTNADGSPIYAANLTGAKISFYDEASPDLHTTARFRTSTGTFSSNGTCTFVAQSALSVGATGSVVVWVGDKRYTSSVVVS